VADRTTLLIALAGLLACGKAVDAEPAASPPTEAPRTAPAPESTPSETASTARAAPEAVPSPAQVEPTVPERARRAPAKDTALHEVVRVIDGDTIQVDVDGTLERVRYIGMDTPETVHPRKPVECYGKEASARNAELVGGKKVRLVRDVSDRDRYGRLLRYVWVDDVFVNLRLVEEGYAMVSTYPPDVEHTEDFLAAQRAAREANRGLWRACPVEAEAARQQEAPRPSAPPEGPKGCPIKGNINARGDRIYHRPDCPSYTRTKIDESAGQRWFCSEAEAEAAGWRIAQNCP
jgi:micrococcal nuclease